MQNENRTGQVRPRTIGVTKSKLLDEVNHLANCYSSNYEEYCDYWNGFIEFISVEVFMLIKGEERNHV